MELVARFVLGGLAVSAFALLADLLSPKSFAGLFGAAPSVALASLGLTIAQQGRAYAALECRSMIAGAVALGVYSGLVAWLLIRRQATPLRAALYSAPAWFGPAFGLWSLFLR